MYKWLMILLLGGSSAILFAQKSYRIVSYNVENLFDTKDDTLTNDQEFTPAGKYHWNQDKYRSKLLKLGRTLTAMEENGTLVLIALCEIENASVLNDLLKRTALRPLGFNYLHHDSPDPRGIDVALLYRESSFRPISQRFIRIDSLHPSLKTREILYTCGILAHRDTLHLFVCHLPSMVGGEKKSEWKREAVAGIMRREIDSLLARNTHANILIMGDFNGTAQSSAQRRVLRAQAVGNAPFADTTLYNTSTASKSPLGSYKYRSQWQTIDHIIVSGHLLNGDSLQCTPDMQIFAPESLLEEDKNGVGYKPCRTFSGFTYHNGTSDHLPVYVDLFRKE